MNLIKDANKFLDTLFVELDEIGLDLGCNFLDHICYRTSDESSYNQMKKEFDTIGVLLIESLVGGRLIATFKLNNPIAYKGRSIDIIEVPAPKDGKVFKNGFEHAEFVIEESFEELDKSYPELNFNYKGANKSINPELMLSLKSVNIKFHHMSLEEVVKEELRTL